MRLANVKIEGSVRPALVEDDQLRLLETDSIASALSLIASGFAPVSDVRRTLTPQLAEGDSTLVLIDLGAGKNRLGGSCLAQVYGQAGDETPDAPTPDELKAFFHGIQQLNLEGRLLAYHDRSDGGLFVTLLEMAFAGNVGLDITLPAAGLKELFSEELGAVVQVATKDLDDVVARLNASGLTAQVVGQSVSGNEIVIRSGAEIVYKNSRTTLHKMWAETSYHIQSLRDNPESAKQEFSLLDDAARPGLSVTAPFDPQNTRYAIWGDPFYPDQILLGAPRTYEISAAFKW